MFIATQPSSGLKGISQISQCFINTGATLCEFPREKMAQDKTCFHSPLLLSGLERDVKTQWNQKALAVSLWYVFPRCFLPETQATQLVEYQLSPLAMPRICREATASSKRLILVQTEMLILMCITQVQLRSVLHNTNTPITTNMLGAALQVE